MFRRGPGSDAARLARKVGPHPGQAGQKILQLRQLDLEPAFTVRARRAKMSRISWVRSRTLRLVSCSRLRPWAGESSSSKIKEVTCFSPHSAGDLLGLALADIEGRRGLLQLLDNGIHHLRAGGGGELTKLGQRILDIPTADSLTFQTDENGFFLKPRVRSAIMLTPRRFHGARGDSCVSRRPVKSMIWNVN